MNDWKRAPSYAPPRDRPMPVRPTHAYAVLTGTAGNLVSQPFPFPSRLNMKSSKFFASTVAAAAVIGAIGIAYAQTAAPAPDATAAPATPAPSTSTMPAATDSTLATPAASTGTTNSSTPPDSSTMSVERDVKADRN